MKYTYTPIEEGDVVSVNFNTAQMSLCDRAIVKHVPIATGDSWQFLNLDTGERRLHNNQGQQT
jgi:hypothetical protein